jgi:hypothetical protein
MPQFPRFTSGSVGRLTFDVVNDLFARVESLEASMRETRTGVSQIGSRILLLKVLATRTSQSVSGCVEASWEEVSSSPCGGVSLPNARTSTKDTDQYFYPLYGRSLVQGTVVPAFPHYESDGRLVYRAIEATASGFNPFFVRITGNAPMPPAADGKVYRWKYTWRESIFTGAPPPSINQNWYDKPNGRNSDDGNYAYNSLEQDGIVGLGGSGPSSAQEFPAPIANNVVVAILTGWPVGFPIFSAGPGMSVNCV